MLEDFNFHDDLTQEAYEPSQKTSYASHKENQSPLHHRDKEKSLLQLLEQEKEEWEKENNYYSDEDSDGFNEYNEENEALEAFLSETKQNIEDDNDNWLS